MMPFCWFVFGMIEELDWIYDDSKENNSEVVKRKGILKECIEIKLILNDLKKKFERKGNWSSFLENLEFCWISIWKKTELLNFDWMIFGEANLSE